MYCVVLSHTVQVPPFYRCVFEPFFLTTFFFLSGVVFKTDSAKKSLLGSTIKVLWPYFINSIIVMLGRMTWIELLFNGDITGVMEYFQRWVNRIIIGDVFWFLACLFIVQLFATFIIHVVNNKKLYISIFAIGCFTSIFLISGKEIAPWSANTAILALGYFLTGSMCRDMLMSFDSKMIKRHLGVLAMAIYVTIIVIIYVVSPQPILFDIHTHKLSPEMLYILLSLIGISAICLFAMSLRRCKLLELLGENSLIIYMYHGYGLLITNTLFGLWHNNGLAQFTYVYPILVSVMSTLLTLGIALLINKYCPILIGKGSYVKRISSKLMGN